ncbi:MAG: TMEM43 family protein [Prevotella sp.]|nr:TMEM43 family protein [Prevotella sp.]
MAYTETTTTGYGTRVGNSFKSIGTGFILFCAATALLWWNEGRAVKTAKMLEEAGGAWVEMPNPDKKDAALDGELVCGTAMATTQDSLGDAQFGVGEKGIIALKRKVEYYQWVEHAESKSEDKLGGKEVTTTTYTYSQQWVSSPVQSSQFKDPAYQNKNTVLTTVDDQDQWAENVTFGAYKLPEGLIHSISSSEAFDLAINENLLAQFDKSTQTAYERFYGVQTKTQQPQQPAQPQQNVVLSDSAKAVADSLQAVNDSINKAMENAQNKKDFDYVHQAGNVLYFGRVPGSPQVGDVRVTFEKIVPAKVTVMAVVDGDSFKAFKAKNGKRFQTLVMGKKTGDEIIEDAEDANSTLTWILRIVGIMLVISALKMIFGFLTMILKVVPFLASIMGFGVGIVCTVIGVVWSLIVIAIAWIFYRPVLGIILLILAAFLIWVFAFKGKEKLKELAAKAKEKAQQPAPAAAPAAPAEPAGTITSNDNIEA